jgi:UDP-glucose 4-epimerase
MKLLVTGGAGYIGSVVSLQLVKAGHEVTVLDNLSKGHEAAVPEGARFVRTDLLDAGRLAEILAEGYDGVLHFAALSLVGESVEQPGRYYRANLAGTLNLLDAMQSAGASRLVFSSTAAVYGEPEEIPIPETAPTRSTSPYGGSKLAADDLIGFFARAHGLKATCLRYFNVAGASGFLGEDHEPETHLIPLVLRAALGDLGRAHLLALEAADEAMREGEHRVYNLGNGAGFSVREVIEEARRVTGVSIEAVEAPRRPGDPPILVASSALIQDQLDWIPKKPSLEAMVSDAWDWMQRHPRGYEES